MPSHSPTLASPLVGQDWDTAVRGCQGVSLFHTQAWARVLAGTYRQIPHYFLERGNGNLTWAQPVMEVRSPLTGRRGVSLPFSDHCAALGEARYGPFPTPILDLGRQAGWRYYESRGGMAGEEGEVPVWARFLSHTIDLRAPVSTLTANLEAAMRRSIKKAESLGVQVEFDRSEQAVRAYYHLHCLTRKRHGVPPQSLGFFLSIWKELISNGRGVVALAKHQGVTVAGLVLLWEGNQAMYKFGASDFRFQSTRSSNLVMWEAIKHLASKGMTSLDLGRTDFGNEGLRRFKKSFGGQESTLVYHRYDFRLCRALSGPPAKDEPGSRWVRLLPLWLSRRLGSMLYPHVA